MGGSSRLISSAKEFRQHCWSNILVFQTIEDYPLHWSPVLISAVILFLKSVIFDVGHWRYYEFTMTLSSWITMTVFTLLGLVVMECRCVGMVLNFVRRQFARWTGWKVLVEVLGIARSINRRLSSTEELCQHSEHSARAFVADSRRGYSLFAAIIDAPRIVYKMYRSHGIRYELNTHINNYWMLFRCCRLQHTY